jgi:hypothetical protein
VTQIANGLSTTTFTYDNNGNVTQQTVDGTTTTYVYDYANRLTALGVGGAIGGACRCMAAHMERLPRLTLKAGRKAGGKAGSSGTRVQK